VEQTRSALGASGGRHSDSATRPEPSTDTSGQTQR
jgi:hypothetical protein